MPTTLPRKARRGRNSFALFAVLLGLSFFVIEVLDPAPMSVEASAIVSP